MNQILWIMAAFSIVCSAAENNLESLREQIKVMVKELDTNDSKKVKSFIIKYADLGELEIDANSEKMDSMANDFMKKRQVTLKKALIKTYTLKPIIKKSRNIYSFKLGNEKINGESRSKIDFKYSKKSNIFLIVN